MSDSDTYFDAGDDLPQSLEPPVYANLGAMAELTVSEGLTFRPAVGNGLMVNLVEFAPNTAAPSHRHVEEQAIYVLDGSMTVRIGEEQYTLGPGETVIIPPYVPHEAWTSDEGCRELDIFTPPRSALLALMSDDD